ncbi:MAG TPA: dipeptidase [Pirellulaceae bacterium]
MVRSLRARLVVMFVMVPWGAVFADDPAPSEKPRQDFKVSPEAAALHKSALVVDGHNDLPWALRDAGDRVFKKIDIAQAQPKFHTDIPRLRQGGVGAQFWSVYVPASTRNDGTALQTTLEQIDIVDAMLDRYPETFERALTADDVMRVWKSGKIASLIGVEGGHSIENSLNALRQLFERGARYMTLTHSDTLDWADSATDVERHGGLTPFGEEVVREMNRLGMLVDISHVSIKTMHHTLRVTKAPIIFSHSSARAIADHPRNVPDEVLRELPGNGGVVMVNFYSGFVVPASTKISAEYAALRMELMKKYPDDRDRVGKELKEFELKHPLARGSIQDVLDHIDHIVKVAGIDHVGLGSDFDGISMVPVGLEDVATYPHITQGLLDRGYSHEDIRKILGENLVRVMRGTERTAMEEKRNKGREKPETNEN